MNIRMIVANGLLAAMYIAISMVLQPIAFSAIQFRFAEIFNHLIVLNRKFIYGIVLGVFLTNLLFSPMKPFDLTFGVAHSIICLLISLVLFKFVKNIWLRMLVNTIVFTVMMWIIALQLKLAIGLPFLFTWLTTAIGEFAVLIIGMPIIYFLYKQLYKSNLALSNDMKKRSTF